MGQIIPVNLGGVAEWKAKNELTCPLLDKVSTVWSLLRVAPHLNMKGRGGFSPPRCSVLIRQRQRLQLGERGRLCTASVESWSRRLYDAALAL